MTWLLSLTTGLAAGFGVYLALSRDGLRCLVGLSILGSAINILVFAAGRVQSAIPPIIPQGQAVLQAAANPLPQALVLTAIVIGLALMCFGLVLLLGIVRTTGTDDLMRLREAEPVPEDPIKPPLAEPVHRQQDIEPGVP